jgi:hypothetical protein
MALERTMALVRKQSGPPRDAPLRVYDQVSPPPLQRSTVSVRSRGKGKGDGTGRGLERCSLRPCGRGPVGEKRGCVSTFTRDRGGFGH